MGELRFDGRVAIVTGGGRGLGREYALLLAGRGACVLVNDMGATKEGVGHDPGPARDVVAEIEAAGGTAAPNLDSVATSAGARSIFDQVIDLWGKVDILINNAGGGSGAVPIDKAPEADLRRMFDAHVMGAFFLIGAVWPEMVRRGYGRILNTSSAASLGLSGEYAYSAAKAALLGLTKSLAVDGEQYGIRVNAILPTAYTRLADDIPVKEVLDWMKVANRPEQVAAVAAALVHEDVPFTGEAISAGGGRAARVFFGVVPGFVDAGITPEMFLKNIDTVLSTEHFIVAIQIGDEGKVMNLPEAIRDQSWIGPEP